jgi:hypothetical protein
MLPWIATAFVGLILASARPADRRVVRHAGRNPGRVTGRGCLLALAVLWPSLVKAECRVERRAVIPLEIIGTVVLTQVAVNGVDGTFVLDTGAARTVVTPDAVERFGLLLDEWTSTTMRGVGGVERRRNANPRSLALGGIALRRRGLAHDQTLAVATLPANMGIGRRVDGLLGRDFLSGFDLDLNFPLREMTLYGVRECSGRFLPWRDTYLSVPVENPAESALVVPVL